MTIKTVGLTSLLLLSLGGAAAQAPLPDLKGGQDHPLIQRFQGSALTGYAQTDWTSVELPAALRADKSLDRLQPLEGREIRVHYLSPAGKTALEVQRNYEQALRAAGLQLQLQCELRCEALYRTWRDKAQPFERGLVWHDRGIPGTGFSMYDAVGTSEARMLVGTLTLGPRTAWVLVFSNEFQDRKSARFVSTFVQIVEPKAMPTGQVSVDARALGQGLQAQGKVALYGLLFDTGKSELKPESQGQLDEMVAVLKAQPALKVLIVGHTDNVGAIEANLALSQARAQAVVAALSKAGVAPARLQARGVANFAPLAANTSEDGRARNRRVEMVAQ